MLPNSGNLVSRSNQDQLGSVASLRGRVVRTGIDLILGHDATPVLHPALECSQLSITEPAWMGCTQPGEQILGGGLRMLLSPQQHLVPDAFEGGPSWFASVVVDVCALCV